MGVDKRPKQRAPRSEALPTIGVAATVRLGGFLEATGSMVAQGGAIDARSFEEHALQIAYILGFGRRANGSKIVSSRVAKACPHVPSGCLSQLRQLRSGIFTYRFLHGLDNHGHSTVISSGGDAGS